MEPMEAPVPDARQITTDELRREIARLQEVIVQRLDAYDKAIALLQSQVDREPKPPVLSADIAHTKEMLEKYIQNVDMRFSERDKRNEQAIRDGKALIDNTIQAMKEAFAKQTDTSQSAITKAEIAIAKQMDQIESKFGTEIKALSSKIDDVKTRITTLESVKVGQNEQKSETKDMNGYIIGVMGVVISLVTVMFLVYNNTSKINNIRDVEVQRSPPQVQTEVR